MPIDRSQSESTVHYSPLAQGITLSGTWQEWDYRIYLHGDSRSGPKVVGLVLLPSDSLEFDPEGPFYESIDPEELDSFDQNLTARALRKFPLTEIVRAGLASESGDADQWLQSVLELTRDLEVAPKNLAPLVTAVAYANALERGSRKPTADVAQALLLSVSAVQTRLQRARDLGILEPADRPGLTGGRLTPEGERQTKALLEKLNANRNELESN